MDEQRVEADDGARCRIGDAAHGGVGELVRGSDDEGLECLVRVQLRPAICGGSLGRGHHRGGGLRGHRGLRRMRGMIVSGGALRNASPHANAHVDGVEAAEFGLADLVQLRDVMGLDP